MSKLRGILAGFLAVIVIATGAVASPLTADPAQALSGSEFEAGNIISDELFYDSAAMSQGEIQGFLNSQIGTCLNGSCLNVLTVAATSRPAEVSGTTGALVCSAFEGGTLTAAAIIYRAQVACGISAKVILVMLQKEQSLVSATAPSLSRLDRAMGMACPDTAPCAAYALGFANQVYEGAKQLKVYSAGRFARQPGVHSIAYNPSSSCGSGIVTIQNYATAALYNYTPYQPNAAALANLGGVGDSCSSYGNRNFWAYYNNWFGPTQTDYATDSRPQLLAVASNGDLWMYAGNGRGAWLSPKKLGNGWSSLKFIAGAGDFDGDGHRDVLAVDTAGALWLFPRDGLTGWLTPVKIADGFGAATAVFSPGDWSGDGYPDLMVRDATGLLWLYKSNGRGVLSAPVQIGNGWESMTALFSAGDFDGDSDEDIMARNPQGDLWLYPGNGRSGWGTPVKIGTGWSGLSGITSPGDYSGDGAVDIVGRAGDGVLWLYPGNGRGGWGTPSKIGTGWGGMTTIVGPGAPAGRVLADQAGVGDLNGDGPRDVLTIDSQNSMYLFAGDGKGGWLAGTPSGVAVSWAGLGVPFGVGDFDGNGSPDVLARDSAGLLWRYASDGRGGFGAPVQIGEGWQSISPLFGVGDFDGDGKQDVMGRDANGLLFLYSGNGAGGWLATRQVGNGWNTLTSIFGGGDFDGDGAQDVIGRDLSGALFLYSGDGAGGWNSVTQIGTGWGGMTAIFSPGDFSGDGYPDIIARTASGLLVLYPGNGKGGWLAARYIGYGWQGMTSIS